MATARPDDSRLPYLQILEELRDGIADGTIAPGDKLPTNAELKRKYGVASQTAQNAINALKGEELVYGVAGRGVFVRKDVDVEALRNSTSDLSNKSMGEVLARMNELDEKVDGLERVVRELRDRIGDLEGSGGNDERRPLTK